MKLAILLLGVILSNGDPTVCTDCEAEQAAFAAADQAYADAENAAIDAAYEYMMDQTPENYGYYLAALDAVDLAEQLRDDAQQAYLDCILQNGGGPIEDELLSTTVSILE